MLPEANLTDATSTSSEHVGVDYVEQSRDEDFFPPHSSTPTEAWPGSQAKLAVMQARYRSGQELHHSEDATWVSRSSTEIDE